jgi:hypothetical protein
MTTYYSVATGLEKGTRMTVATPAGDMNIVSEIKSYGAQDGIKFAAETEAKLPNGMSQVVKIAKMEVKNQIDADAFALPEDVRKLLTK